jgi:hypothetical protein
MKIINLKANLNKGISKQLKIHFPNEFKINNPRHIQKTPDLS